MDIENEIMCLNNLILQYEETGNIDKLGQLLAQGFTILRASGERQNRDDFLNSVRQNRDRGRRASQPQVQIIADTAMYSCMIETTRNPDGTPNPGSFINTRMFIRENDEWRCSAWQVTRIPDAADAQAILEKASSRSSGKMAQTDPLGQEKDMAQIQEMVMDHLGIPRPGQSEHIHELQDNLMPAFMETARYAWLAQSPYQVPRTTNSPTDPAVGYLQSATEANAAKVDQMNQILNALGVHALLEDVAASPQVANLSGQPLEPYELRLLRAAGHPNPEEVLRVYLQRAARNPEMLASSEEQLNKAAQASLSAHSIINSTININVTPPGATQNDPATAKTKPNPRKLFTGLGTLFSGLVLIAGDAVLIPSIPALGVTAIPIVSSLAEGVAAVGKGSGELNGEGDK